MGVFYALRRGNAMKKRENRFEIVNFRFEIGEHSVVARGKRTCSLQWR